MIASCALPAVPSPNDRSATRTAGVARIILVVGLLYAFLAGIGLLQAGIATLSPSLQESLFASITHPLAGLAVGILATVLTQSSSATTATIVGLVGAGLIDVGAAVPMIMGANIGTTVTSTLATLGHVRRPEEFRLAFAAATVHDFYNLISVMVLLPLELATGIIARTAQRIATAVSGAEGSTATSPIRTAVEAPVDLLTGALEIVGARGTLLAIILIGGGLAIVIGCLGAVTSTMRRLIANRLEDALNRVLSRGGGVLALLVGVVVTLAVQSSTITTSLLVPLAASGVLSLRNAYPVTVGANVGTTMTAVLASLASGRPEALAIALVHVLFNLASVLLLYPIPALREIPMRLAEGIAALALRRRPLVVAYVAGTFIVAPIIALVTLT